MAYYELPKNNKALEDLCAEYYAKCKLLKYKVSIFQLEHPWVELPTELRRKFVTMYVRMDGRVPLVSPMEVCTPDDKYY